MKLPRGAKIFRGQLDAAPFASVFFLLALFLLLSSKLVFTPGVRIDLPDVSRTTPGTTLPTEVVAVDRNGQFYYEGQVIAESDLLDALKKRLAGAHGRPLALMVQADGSGRIEPVLRLVTAARAIGFRESYWATRPATTPRRQEAAP